MLNLNVRLLQLLYGLFFVITCVKGWDSKQLEVFDVVEEVKVNFYEFMNVPQDAPMEDIKSSFKNLTRRLHPDKNKHEDTSEQFRNLVSIYEVLKDVDKRKYYDEVLVNGLPNWRSAVYYYRHVRKMGLLESSFILFAIITIGQYLVAWASYLETQYTLSQRKKTKKERAANIIIDIPKPSFLNTLPVQIPKLFFYIIVSFPKFVMFLKEKTAEKIQEIKEKEEESEEEVVVVEKGPRRRKPGFVVPEGPTFQVQSVNNQSSDDYSNKEDSIPPPVSGGLWTDDDLDELVQLVKKYPGGTPKRWELIAEAIGRSVAEVTFMANKLKSNPLRNSSQEEQPPEPPKQKQKTKGGKLGLNNEQGGGVWTQQQQKALEEALAKFPKGVSERWDRIAEHVPNKTKEECILRFKHLAEMIKKQREDQEKVNNTDNNEDEENN